MDFILGSRITFGDRQTFFYHHLTADYRHLTADYRHLMNAHQLFYGCDCGVYGGDDGACDDGTRASCAKADHSNPGRRSTDHPTRNSR